MKLKQLLSVATLLTVSFSQSIFANLNDIQLGHPIMRGTGCPAGTASSTLSPDRKSLSVLFDSFMVEAGGGSGRTLDRKSCNFAVPLHIPQGFSVSLIRADYRGFVDVPNVAGASARFTAEYFFAGYRGPRVQRTFNRGYSNDYVISKTLPVRGLVWSPCGKDVNLRINAGMMIKNRNRNVDALATVDSADFNAGIVYRLSWRSCH